MPTDRGREGPGETRAFPRPAAGGGGEGWRRSWVGFGGGCGAWRERRRFRQGEAEMCHVAQRNGIAAGNMLLRYMGRATNMVVCVGG